jgi:uncharacterized membrane protein YoaK (UPF0700 family)
MHLELQKAKLVQISNVEPLDSVRKALLAIGLTWIAGFVDIVGYIVLKQILNANMSGNTVLMPYHLFQQGPVGALARGLAVLTFVAGLIACACIHEACIRHGILSSAAVTLGLEALLIVVFVLKGGKYVTGTAGFLMPRSVFYSLIALACGAMGLQNATLTRVGALTVRTTHVTGTLAKFAESWSRYMFWFYDKTRGPREGRFREAFRLSFQHEDFKDAGITAGLWVGFLLGALCGVWLLHLWLLNSLFLPVAVLLAFVAADLQHPITARKQSA